MRLPDLEQSSTRSNVKTMTIRCLDTTLAKNILKRAIKGHSHIGCKIFLGQTPCASQSPNRFGECWNCWLVNGVATKTNLWILAYFAGYELYKRIHSATFTITLRNFRVMLITTPETIFTILRGLIECYDMPYTYTKQDALTNLNFFFYLCWRRQQ